MPGIEFFRDDLRLRVRPLPEGGAEVQWAYGFVATSHVPADVLEGWLDGRMGSRLFDSLPPPMLAGWGGRSSPEVIPRVTVEAADPALAAAPWEALLGDLLLREAAPRVRVTPTRAREADHGFSLPLRILHVDPPGASSVADVVGRLLGWAPDADRAVRVRPLPLEELRRLEPSEEWPTAEVLHLERFPEAPDPMSTASPDRPGTLGWLARLCDRFQTRLVVLRGGDREAAMLRRVAARLTARGGPAVLVAPGADAALDSFYADLVHDFPLDAALGHARQPPGWSLFAGAGREEALRVSALGEELVRAARQAESESESETPLLEAFGVDVRPPPTTTATGGYHHELEHELKESLGRLEHELPQLRYDLHEREGLVPVAREMDAVRAAIRSPGPRPRPAPAAAPPSPTPAPTRRPRFVNATLSSADAAGKLERVDQKRAALRRSEVYQLGVQVGPPDVALRTARAQEIAEETFRWTPEDAGAWIEVAVTGLDFDVLGDPVQEVWLPRGSDPSEALYFAVAPRADGVARLRFCVYHRQNVVQSFRLAALVLPPGEPLPPAEERARRLAAALDLDPEEVGDSTWLPRLEYATAATADGIAGRPDRALSIVANDLDGRAVVTVKGPDVFGVVETDESLRDTVRLVRKQLLEVSSVTVPGPDGQPEAWYAFAGPADRPNAADPDRLRPALGKLADVGWQLFDSIIPQSERAKLGDALLPERRTIHVAHVLAEKVIPWALMYDRPYDAARQAHGGRPVAHDACLASVGPGGALKSMPCGSDPACLLHADQCARRERDGLPLLLEETVACPLRFWGFKHVVEVPPQQADAPSAGGATNLPDEILATRPANLVLGLNPTLRAADTHRRALEALEDDPGLAFAWRAAADDGDRVIDALKDPDLDVAYLYCHARGGEVDPSVKPPCLEFAGSAGPRRVLAAHLAHDQPWRHRPLVFLNGCGTVGFSPDALSPFIRKLVRDRGAAGVIGAEVSVWEQLAGEVALHFLRAFLRGDPAGDALLQARRALLSQYNPLGLVYTLYAAADLHLPPAAAAPAGAGGAPDG